MPYRVSCPACKAVYLVPDDTLGKKLSCKKCQQPFLVGSPQAPLPAASQPAKPSKPAPVNRERSKGVQPRPAAKAAPPRSDAIKPDAPSSGKITSPKKSSRWLLLTIAAVVLTCSGAATGFAVTALYYLKQQKDTPLVQLASNPKEQERTNPAAPERKEQTRKAKAPAQEPNESIPKPAAEVNGLPADLDRVPRDALAFCSLRVADTLKKPMAAGLCEQLQHEPLLKQYRMLLGLGVEDIERAVIVFLALKPEVEGVALVTTEKPYDRERLLFFVGPDKEERKAGSATYYAGKKSPIGVHFVNERTFLVGLEKDVKKFLERPIGKDQPGPLSEALASAARAHTLVFAARPGLLAPIEKKDVPPPYQGYLPLLDAQSATLTVNADQDLRMGLRLAFANEEQAKKGEQAAKEAVSFASLVMRQFPAMLEKIPDPAFKPMIPKVRGLIEALASALVETPPRRRDVVVVHTLRIQSPDWFNTLVAAAPFLAPRPVKPGPGPGPGPRPVGPGPGPAPLSPSPRKVALPKTPEEAEAAIKKLGGEVYRNESEPGKPITEVTFEDVKVTDDDLILLRPIGTLVRLRLWNNKEITDKGLENLAAYLPRLRSLTLVKNRVTNAGLAHLSKLKNLAYLNVSRCQITDQGLTHLRDLKKLDFLTLKELPGVTDAGLVHLKDLVNLTHLDLSYCRITDKGLAHLKPLKKLEDLTLAGNEGVTDKGVAELKSALPNVKVSK